MKNRKKIIFLFFLIILIFYSNDVFAKEVANTCTYDFVFAYGSSGSSNYPACDGDQIIVTIYDDESYSLEIVKSLRVSKGEKIKNWGQDFNGIKNIKGKECPDYFIENSEGWFEKSVRIYMVNQEDFESSAKKLVELSTSGRITVMKNANYSEEVPTYDCKYSSSSDGNHVSYKIVVDSGTKTLTVTSTGTMTGVFYHVTDQLEKNWFGEDRGTDECLPTVACSTGVNLAGQINYYIFNDSMEAKAAGYDKCSVRDCIGEDCSDNKYSCITYNAYMKDIKEVYEKIQANKGNAGQYYSEANRLEQQLATLCQGVMDSYTYKEQCVKACVGFEADLARLKVAYGIGLGDGGGSASCSLSERIVGWIFKIVKWMRYLVPILLILLSVLDFIKAIASDSEDEMRKVGAKFVKRLIVAALIFILPLILEFLLGIFNIGTYDYCLK